MQLEKTIKDLIAKNTSEEDIYVSLLQSGKKVPEIRSAFRKATQESEDTQKRTVHVLVTIGAVLIGVGIFSFVASNWQDMSKALKIFLIVAGIVFSYLAGWYIEEKKGYTRTGQALYLLGATIYGAGIFLVAQIFNVRADWPDGVILWMIGVLVSFFFTKMKSLLNLGLLLGIVGIVAYPTFTAIGLAIEGDGFIQSSTVLLVVAAVVTYIASIQVAKHS